MLKPRQKHRNHGIPWHTMAYHGSWRGEKTGAVEDEFERFCRAAVNEARQRCGGRRLVAALKPLLVDLVKRRTPGDRDRDRDDLDH